MDPTETLRLLINTLESGDVRGAREAVGNLRDWHDSGGFMPRWPQSAPECPTGLAAFYLGCLIEILGSARGHAPYKYDSAAYVHVLSLIQRVVS